MSFVAIPLGPTPPRSLTRSVIWTSERSRLGHQLCTRNRFALPNRIRDAQFAYLVFSPINPPALRQAEAVGPSAFGPIDRRVRCGIRQEGGSGRRSRFAEVARQRLFRETARGPSFNLSFKLIHKIYILAKKKTLEKAKKRAARQPTLDLMSVPFTYSVTSVRLPSRRGYTCLVTDCFVVVVYLHRTCCSLAT